MAAVQGAAGAPVPVLPAVQHGGVRADGVCGVLLERIPARQMVRGSIKLRGQA